MKRSILLAVAFAALSAHTLPAQVGPGGWKVGNPREPIFWNIDAGRLPHSDHIEMSGEQISVVLRWSVGADSAFVCERSLVFPMLRTIPNNTHASLNLRVAFDPLKHILVDGRPLSGERLSMVSIEGNLCTESTFTGGGKLIEVRRELSPSTTLPAFVESYTVRNAGPKPVTLIVPELSEIYTTDPAKGVDGAYSLHIEFPHAAGCYTLLPQGPGLRFGVTLQGYKKGGHIAGIDTDRETMLRRAFVRDTIGEALVLETPEPIIDKMFEFAKVRAAESIFKTAGGYMHGPGGEAYYAAIWANDQAEYANPLFPLLGYGVGNASALNSLRHFARFMNPAYAPLPSSIIAGGIDIWNGAGDRGDAAMVAYGAARYALERGDVSEAREVWPLVEWCLEYCRRNLGEGGVVRSDSDELEGRFPAVEANLATSSLYYDALVSAAHLARELGLDGSHYRRQAQTMRENIESYFGDDALGFHTYRYYKGNDRLRSWICIPLTVGIFERAEGTVEALFSPRLWTSDGLLTQEGSSTFWDRSTLYALRGVYAAGYVDRATDYLTRYSERRLTGDHVPYAIEAWPEGNQRHLSAESALYCRVITEGLFGIRPTGFRSFTLLAQLPSGWESAALRRVGAFGGGIDIEYHRLKGERIKVVVRRGGVAKEYIRRNGETVEVKLNK